MRKIIILASLLAFVITVFAQTEIFPRVVDNGGGMRSPAAGDTLWASIGQGAIGVGCEGITCLCAGYLYVFDGTCLEVLETNTIPKTFAIAAIYRNPFNSACNVEIELSEQTDITIDLYDMQGRKVKDIANEKNVKAGKYRMRWNAENLPSGVYFVRLNAGDRIITKRAMLMK